MWDLSGHEALEVAAGAHITIHCGGRGLWLVGGQARGGAVGTTRLLPEQ